MDPGLTSSAMLQPPPCPLLGPGDPPPFEIVNPDAPTPLLLTSDHNGNRMPAALDNLGLAAPDLERHIAYDIGADRLTRGLSERLCCAAVLANYSRLLIDNNRHPGDPTSILEISDGTPVPGNRRLTEADKIRRTECFFHPYHHAISGALDHLWRAGGVPPALLSIHTFTPSLDGRDRHWHIGVLWNRDPRLAVPLIDLLRGEPGLQVGDNVPYSGKETGYTMDRHAGAAGLPHAVVEIRQDLVDDADGAGEWIGRLTAALSRTLRLDGLRRVTHY